MATTTYVTTGEYRHTALLITKTVNGEAQNEVYSLLASFEAPALGQTFPEITAQQLQRLSVADHAQRVEYFLRHVKEALGGKFEPATDIVNQPAGQSAEDGVLACVDNR